MLQQVMSRSSHTSERKWRKFDATAPAPDETVEIRRLHDDKTILRRRSELSPAFDWRHAEWRPL